MNTTKNGIRILHSHTQQRARERLGRVLDKQDYTQVLKCIRSGEATPIQYGKWTQYRVPLNGRMIEVGYDADKGFVTTVLRGELRTNLGAVLRRAMS